MKTRTTVCIVALCGVLAVVAGRAASQEPAGAEKAFKPPSPEEMQKAMAAYMKLGQPGPNHRHLEPLIGKWDTVSRMWMAGPDQPPTESKGTAENRWVLDGRFMLSEAESLMQMPNPADPEHPMKVPFKGMGLTGYNNFRNTYFGSWADNMGTQMLTFKGTRNPQSGEFVYYGEMDEPYLPGIGQVVGRYVRYVTRIINKNKHVLEVYDLHVGEGYKAFEIVYTRRK